ncbi:MAG: ribbon-helix-helix protein, CopG family, partial [Thiogranum sp.]
MSVTARNNVSRISISLPEPLLRQFDDMVGERGFESRSQAIAE